MFTDQISKPLEIEDLKNITVIMNQIVKYKKMMGYSVKTKDYL